ncbi:translation initiation factor 2 [Pseudomonas sp. PCH199]|uniref:translation initiation factor 2 n=1 Tax=unclassified Pseudomonas TaxID=196821 RepID=UPI000BC3F176|nr:MULTISPECIES: translation initiation factor 2 [unclassified Pseudomonas]MCW8276762.1 translation initiation factor 2 [Pseudomonas sp. PCH199]PAM83044.1 translation initiation factor 2 [Pseudomonas sp. ERMR1:02]
MKPIFPAAWLLICLLVSAQPVSVLAASVQDKPAASTPSKNLTPAKKTAPVKKKAAAEKKRPPMASKSKPASEVVKTQLPSPNLDLSLPKDMVEELKPIGTVPLPRHETVLPQMFGDKSSQFQLNGRLISNEMKLQLRNEERREVEGAALEFEFKR